MAKKKAAKKKAAKKKAAPKAPATPEITLQPLGDRVVVERDVAEDVTAGGILLPETAKKKPSRGTILSKGEGRMLSDGSRKELQVAVGDKVYFLNYRGESFKFGDRELLLLSEQDILAIIE